MLMPVLEPRLSAPFDVSRMVDFREEVLFPKSSLLVVDLIQPLVVVPGCLGRL